MDRLKDMIPNQYVDDWEWRAGVVYFTPCTMNVDLRLRGDFLPAGLVDEKDQVLSSVKNFGNALGYGVASLIGLVRGNPGWAQSYTLMQDNSLDDVMQYLSRKDQQKVRRVGRMVRNFTADTRR